MTTTSSTFPNTWPAPALAPLPLGAIRPLGWLRDQLRIQAGGLSGHLDEFWPSVAQSKWIGGDSEGWERGPYWLDGVVPLACLLDDAVLKAKVQRWMDYILDHQHPDGWLGVIEDSHEGSGQHVLDPWPIFVLLKAMTQWQEATGDARIIPAMQRVLRRIDGLLDERPLESWAAMRWFELSVSLVWLYARTGEAWILELSQKAQSQGYDWPAHFAEFPYTEKQTQEWTLENHVVNNAMALKEAAFHLPRSENGTETAKRWMAILDQYHGQAAGVFSGDESLAGLSPSQGTETCAVVEYLYSLELLLAAFGDPAFGDRLERIAFNALPAPFKSDMWARQYDQQANQVVCKLAPDGERIYTNNFADSNLFSLEGNFGCCTANMHQGWPKLVSHLWAATPDGGLAAVAYGPCAVQATVAGGFPVTIVEETEYPFRGKVQFTIETSAPTLFPLHLRIPAWAAGATYQLNASARLPAESGTFATVYVGDGMTVTLHLPMTIRTERGFKNSLRVLRGPLVFSLQIGEEFRQIKGESPHADWEVYPTTPWNYGLALGAGEIAVIERPVGPVPYAPDAPPVTLTVPARRVTGWDLHLSCAAPPPVDPVAEGPVEQVTLSPYGSGHLRVTDFPEVQP